MHTIPVPTAVRLRLGRARRTTTPRAIALGLVTAGLTIASGPIADAHAAATDLQRLAPSSGRQAAGSPHRIKAKPRRGPLTAKAADVPKISYRIVSRHDRRCLDNDIAAGPTDGTRVQVWDCNGWDNQRWYYRTDDQTIRSAHDGRCLDADTSTRTHNGTSVQVWGCWGTNNQRWFAYADGTIRSAQDGRCLDLDVASRTRNGTKVQLWDCNGWDNQAWDLNVLP
jgi:hypothetical protein